MNQKKMNFNRISSSRVNKIIDLISKLHNLSNSSFYEYEEKEIDEIFNRIQKELDKQRQYFVNERKKESKRIEL